MRTPRLLLPALVLGACVLSLSGCNTERAEGQGDKAVLKGGQQVAEDMAGWVAVPDTTPALKQDKDVTYAVLATHNVVPLGLDSWIAVSPALFARLSSLKLEAPKVTPAERWVLSPVGRRVPNEKTGWVAVPYSEPAVQTREAGFETAILTAHNIIPKDMNGWVAISRDTLTDLSARYVISGEGPNK